MKEEVVSSAVPDVSDKPLQAVRSALKSLERLRPAPTNTVVSAFNSSI